MGLRKQDFDGIGGSDMAMFTEVTGSQAIWTAISRTLAAGAPDPPTNRLEQYVKAIWEYATRELTGAAGNPWYYYRQMM
jgi:hypothetical protein